MAISFPRLIPDVGYVASDLILRDTVTASPSGGGLINYTQVAAPVWEVSLETRPLDYDEYSAVEAWWLSLRGGLRSVLFRQPHNGFPMAHRMDQAPARTPGRLASIASGNALSIISVDPALILSAGDRIGLEHANRWYVGRVTEASGTGTTRVISVEPPPPSNIAQAGAVVRFDRPGLLMRPVPDSYQATRSGRHYSVSFRLVEVAGVGSVPRDMDFNFTSPLVAAPYFTRASSATYFGTDGLLKTAAINEPRIDHDPVTREPLGLLIEEPRTNLLLYSQGFAIWDGIDKAVTPDVLIAPDGTITADNIAVDVGGVPNTGFVQFLVNVPVDANSSYIASVFLKKGSSDRTDLNILSGSGAFQQEHAEVHWSADGSIASVANGFYAPAGDGWYRVWTRPLKNNGTNGIIALRLYPHDVMSPAAGEDVYAWGAQLEVGAFPTSYIPTADAQATRAAEIVSIPASDWYSQNGGTLFVECDTFSLDELFQLVAVFTSDTAPSLDNRIYIVLSPSNRSQLVVQSDGFTVANMALPGNKSGAIKAACALKADHFAFAVDGELAGTDNNGVLPAGMGRLTLGSMPGAPGTAILNGHIRRVTYFPRRLSNAELQEITT